MNALTGQSVVNYTLDQRAPAAAGMTAHVLHACRQLTHKHMHPSAPRVCTPVVAMLKSETHAQAFFTVGSSSDVVGGLLNNFYVALLASCCKTIQQFLYLHLLQAVAIRLLQVGQSLCCTCCKLLQDDRRISILHLLQAVAIRLFLVLDRCKLHFGQFSMLHLLQAVARRSNYTALVASCWETIVV